MNKNDGIIIRKEREEDYRKTENLVREAFWDVYREGAVEHYVLHCMRKDPDFVNELDFVMEKDGEIIGQTVAMKAKVETKEGAIDVLTIGPICISKRFQKKGLGKKLLDYTLQKASEQGFGAVLFTGDIGFYGKSGFVVAKTLGITYFDDPAADYFLAKELQKGFFDGKKGTYKDPKVYFAASENEEDFSAFDSSFPKKDKNKKDCQIF